MKISLRTFTFVTTLTLVVSLINTVQAASPASCVRVLAAAQNGMNAVNNLKDNLAAVAAINGKSAAALKALLISDSSIWLDECGLAFYVDEAPKNVTSSIAPSSAPFAYDQTFLLHSKPGSTKTIYLDFNGHTYSNVWNGYFGVASTYTASGYSQDLDFSNFSDAERDVIQSVWQRVSEDYAPFDVDVTTQEPAADVLARASNSDNTYGTRAVITGDSVMQTKCGCGGVAYLGVFDATGTTWANHQPAWVFTRGAKNITEALTHEVGHNLGLNHDGRVKPSEGYYSGAAGWAPIMGVGYYQGLTQWSKGEYPKANNREDDYVVMASNGAAFRTDEDQNSSASARQLTSSISGVISNPSDADWYTFTPGVSGSKIISASVASVSPNLDIRIDLYLSTNLTTPIASSNPPMNVISTDVIGGLNASLTFAFNAGSTYLVKVDGVGFGNITSTGYTDYGSLGSYTLQIS